MHANPDWRSIRQCIEAGAYGKPLDGGPVTLLLETSINSYDADSGVLTVGFSLGSNFLNDNGVVMGGIVSAALDLAMAMTVMAYTAEEVAVATTNLQTQFFRACLPGNHVAKSRLVKTGKRIAFCEAQLFDRNQMHIATATSTNQLIV